MIIVDRKNVGKVPSLTVVKAEKQGQALPTVVYFHGFTSAKEHNLPLAYLLAFEGYRVILPDSYLHGERERNMSKVKKQLAFWNIVLQNVEEIKQIREDLQNKQLILNDRFGVAGTSMGGMTTSAVLTTYQWVKVAAILMGTPKITLYAKQLINEFSQQIKLPPKEEIDRLLKTLETYDLSKQISYLNQRPLFLWHGEKDSVVPFNHAYTFYQQARATYHKKKHISFLKEPGRGHKVSRRAIQETVQWFVKHL